MIDEGYIKFQSSWKRAPAPPAAAVTELNRWRQKLYGAGLIGYYEKEGVGFGNLSVRYGKPGEFIISGTQTGHLPVLDENHYVLVTDHDIDKNLVVCEGPVEASSESLTHAILYDLDSKIQSVVHVHSPDLWQALINKVPTTPADVAYGTPEMAGAFQALYQRSEFPAIGIAVMAGHDDGLISVGRSVAEAGDRILKALQAMRKARS